jgi:hypothetical protein
MISKKGLQYAPVSRKKTVRMWKQGLARVMVLFTCWSVHL